MLCNYTVRSEGLMSGIRDVRSMRACVECKDVKTAYLEMTRVANNMRFSLECLGYWLCSIFVRAMRVAG
jgi:hypothetical protein